MKLFCCNGSSNNLSLGIQHRPHRRGIQSRKSELQHQEAIVDHRTPTYRTAPVNIANHEFLLVHLPAITIRRGWPHPLRRLGNYYLTPCRACTA
jgi:hypothetical protein